MTQQEIKEMPTVIDNNHESLYRSYQVLKKVIDMMRRNDSQETIGEMIIFTTKPKN